MPQPTQRDVHVDAPLTNISIAYVQKAEHFIAGRVFPSVPVAKQSDKYWTYTKGDWFRDEARKRADVTESAGSGYTISSTNTYFCDVYGLHKDVGRQAVNNQDPAINLERDATQFVTQRLLLRREKDWVSTYLSTGVWDGEVTPSNLWDSYTTSDPISDIELGKETILSQTGFLPNTLTLSYQVYRQLKHHPDIVDRIKHTGGIPAQVGSAGRRALADLFELDNLYVAMAVENTAAEGVTTSMSFTHSRDALLCYVNAQPSLLAPSAGYNFTWNGFSGLGTDFAISRIPMPELKATRIEGETTFDLKVISADLGYLFSGAVSS